MRRETVRKFRALVGEITLHPAASPGRVAANKRVCLSKRLLSEDATGSLRSLIFTLWTQRPKLEEAA